MKSLYFLIISFWLIICPHVFSINKLFSQNTSPSSSDFQPDALTQNVNHRPLYHIVIPEADLGTADINGAIYWNEKYHLFFIKKGKWGHISSKNLLDWNYHPTAIENPGAGKKGCCVYSGNVLINQNGVPTAVYWDPFDGISIATAKDANLVKWETYSDNPVITIPQKDDPEYKQYSPHDAHVWQEGNTFYLICSNAKFHESGQHGDRAFLFKSKDMIHWTYLHPLYKSKRIWTLPYEDCSCPDFFELGKKHVLMFISHHSGAQCYLGSYRNRRFYPEQHYRLNWPGGSYFATESLESPDGRRIVWAWVCEQRHPSDWSSEWSAVFSLPRVLSIDEDGTLLMQPAEELKKLRKNHKQRRDIHLKPGQDIRLKRISGDCLEILLRVNPMKSEKVGLKVRCAPDLSEYTEISYNASLSTLSINTERASLSPNIIRPYPNPYAARDPNALAGNKRQDITIQTAPFSLNKGELLEFHIFIDKSIIEVFANGRQAMVQRIYPTRKDSKEIILFSKKNSAWVYSLDAWDISPCEISPETVNDVKN